MYSGNAIFIIKKLEETNLHVWEQWLSLYSLFKGNRVSKPLVSKCKAMNVTFANREASTTVLCGIEAKYVLKYDQYAHCHQRSAQ